MKHKIYLSLGLFLIAIGSVIGQCWLDYSISELHTIAIKQDGTLWAWGINSDYQLGDGTDIDRNSPVLISDDTDWQSV